MRILLAVGAIEHEVEIAQKSAAIIESIFKKNKIAYEKKCVNYIIKNIQICEDFDFVYIVDYGGLGERGALQMMLEKYWIPYSGPNATIHSICKDKIILKKICNLLNVKTPYFMRWETEDTYSKFTSMNFPLIIKPRINSGSSKGLTIIRNENDYLKGVKELLKYDRKGVIEEYHSGEDYIAAFIKKNDETFIKVGKATINKDEDFSNRYNHNYSLFEIVEQNNSITSKIKKITNIFNDFLDINNNFYIDYRVTKNSEIFLLEVGTMYGILDNSIIPEALKSENLTLEGLVLEEIYHAKVCR